MAERQTLRCAIYTRKSSDEGLEQEFNSLDAQREACSAYIKSQAQEGWHILPDRFDDGGHSGGTLERPALQQLLDQVRARRIDVIVIYKIDRLTRSLADFARLAELFDGHGVSFVSVTQQFSTTTSMGRLMLNVLLSFAQFEREITGERIRDKIAASKKKGMWMGGPAPIGFDLNDRELIINDKEADIVRTIYRLYREYGNVRSVAVEVERRGFRTKVRVSTDRPRAGGGPFSRGHIYNILKNPLYIGQISHKGETHPGRHAAIIDLSTWEAVQRQFAANRAENRARRNIRSMALLSGLLVDSDGNRFTHTHPGRAGNPYRYYVERALITGNEPAKTKIRRIPAVEIEEVVRTGIADLLDSPARLVEALGGDINAAAVDLAVREARRLREEVLQSSLTAWTSRIRPMLHQVVIEDEVVRLRLIRATLRLALGLPAAGVTPDLYSLAIPTRVSTRGYRLKLVVGGKSEQHTPDPALLKTLARAHGWWHSLSVGGTAIRDIAAAEGCSASYVSRVLRLAFLAPDIVEAILDGRQPVELTAKQLVMREDLPMDWREQRRRLGLAAD